MTDFWIIIYAILIFAAISSYMYVGVGDYFEDNDGNIYRVIDKNFLFATIENENEKKDIMLIMLCIRYMRIFD